MQDFLKTNDYVSTEEWKEILNNPNVISEKMMSILDVIYNSKNHAATTSQIVEKRKEQGFEDEKSYNSAIVENGKRVKNYLQRDNIFGDDGNAMFWPWFFTGKFVGNEFQFTMKKELVEAFDQLNIKNSTKNTSFMDYLKNKGFLFNPETIENYLLSLKVKPFVIFTGNSGTGKTKLAQLFADFIAGHGDDFKELIESKKIGSFKGNSGKWMLSKPVIEGIIPNVDEYQKKKELTVNGREGTASFELMLRMGIDKGELYDYLAELEDEDSQQKIDLKIILPSKSNNQYELIPVGANWTESRNILGFYNVITEEYNSTPAYELIKEAQENLAIPYFLILDEMNLSHVERYFAEFLSAMESMEPIPISATESVEIPDNLFIVGTVNVDETTYMFSPKVLDRANTIEFKTISAMDYMNSNFNNYVLNGDESYLLNPQSDDDIRNMNINDLREIFRGISYGDRSLWDILSEELEKFQSALKKANFDFGFRVINEILRFMVVSWKYENQPAQWNNWQRYFDAQIKQKMLPKLHGSQKVLGPVIRELLGLCLSGKEGPVGPNVEIEKNNSKYYTSALKLQEMDRNLHNQRYTSFIS